MNGAWEHRVPWAMHAHLDSRLTETVQAVKRGRSAVRDNDAAWPYQRRDHESLFPSPRHGSDHQHTVYRLEPCSGSQTRCDGFVGYSQLSGLPSAEGTVLRGRERSDGAVGATSSHCRNVASHSRAVGIDRVGRFEAAEAVECAGSAPDRTST